MVRRTAAQVVVRLDGRERHFKIDGGYGVEARSSERIHPEDLAAIKAGTITGPPVAKTPRKTKVAS
jgi:hypothetical protein